MTQDQRASSHIAAWNGVVLFITVLPFRLMPILLLSSSLLTFLPPPQAPSRPDATGLYRVLVIHSSTAGRFERVIPMASLSLAFEFPSTTSAISFPASTAPAWVHGQFPPALTLTKNRLAEDLIADVPFLSIGILAFGVATFFFVMNRMQKHVFAALIAALLAFISAILDFGQLLIISKGIFSTGVFPLRISRELGYAASFGIRFYFFWLFVAIPPRGEILILATLARNNASSPVQNKPHSASWDRWGAAGILAKYTLLLGTLAIAVIQSIWRLGFTVGLVRFTAVYFADSILQIAMSALFILKLFGNSYTSPLMPRWRTIRDYLPMMTAILIGLGIAIGNILCSALISFRLSVHSPIHAVRFSECPLGRFLQAVELYIIILYVLIARFYKMPVRTSILAETPPRHRGRGDSSFIGIDMNESMRISAFRVSPPNVSTPDLPAAQELVAAQADGAPARSQRPTASRRQSATGWITSWIQNRLSSRPVDQETDQQVLSRRDLELGEEERYDYTNDKKRFSADQSTLTSSMRPIRQVEYGSQYPGYPSTQTTSLDTPTESKSRSTFAATYTPATSYVPTESMPAGPSLVRSLSAKSTTMPPVAVLPPVGPLNIRTLPSNPRPRPRSPPEFTPPAVPATTTMRILSPPPVLELNTSPSGLSFHLSQDETSEDAPYLNLRKDSAGNQGDQSSAHLEGIIASLDYELLPEKEMKSQRDIRADSATYSPAAASFLQNQFELERSVSNLQRYDLDSSPTPREGYEFADGENRSVPSFERESTSLRSDFTLSNFPTPPLAGQGYPDSQRSSPALRPDEISLENIRFTLLPPRLLTVPNGRQTSFPSTTRGSDLLRSSVLNAQQWDVTSFIGGGGAFGLSVMPDYRFSRVCISFVGSEARASLVTRPESQGRPLSLVRNPTRRDTLDTQRLSMVIEAISNNGGTPDLSDDGSLLDARILQVQRANSLTRARLESLPPATPSSVNSMVLEPTPEPVPEVPTPLPPAAERLAAFRAQTAHKRKPTLPSNPRPAYRTASPSTQRRGSPTADSPTLGSEPLLQSQSPSQPQPSIQVQVGGMQTQPTTTPPTWANTSPLTPPRGLRNMRIGTPVERPQYENELLSGAFERPRPAPLVLANTGSLSGRAI
ncbi:hypothetical protein CTheo_2256 [Ceratobasidium theobromae]|uniref:Transmembrane protein n=1 Tax=Ceratobasidium theobromae TaxID=1582974 RepID=A0A5N5QT30_9AGAM|nr:hypothetical protein CTheo_2256 [Ceratobasidium theobromae]